MIGRQDSLAYFQKKWIENSINSLGKSSTNTISIYEIFALRSWRSENYKEAAKYYLKAIDNALINKEISNSKISEWYSSLSTLYGLTLLNNNVKSNEYLNLSINYKDSLDALKNGWDYWEEGDLHLRNEDFEKAKVYFEKSEYHLLNEKNYYQLFALYLQNIGLSISNRVFSMSDFDFFVEKLDNIKSLIDKKHQPEVDFGYAFIYYNKLNFLKSEKILEKCIPLLNEENEWFYLQSRLLLSRAKFNLGKIDEAFDLMEFCINHFKIKNKSSSTEILTYYESAAFLASTNRPEIA